MTTLPKCVVQLPELEGSEWQPRDITPLTPQEMVAEVSAYRRIAEIAGQPCPPGVTDWASVYLDADLNVSLVELLAGITGPADFDDHPLSYYFGEKAAAKEQLRTIDDLAATVWERIHQFLATPTTEVAQITAIDKIVPNAVEVVEADEAARRHFLAEAVCRDRLAPAVLRVPVVLPETLPVLSGPLEVWIWIAPDENNIEATNPDIFDVIASLVHQTSPENAEIIGVLRGNLIPTNKWGEPLDTEELFEAMDAHSAQLNDVWKAVYTTVLPEFDMDSMDELALLNDDSDALGVSICVPWMLVAQKFRGHALSVVMLKAVASASFDPESALVEDEVLGESIGMATKGFARVARSTLMMLEENPIRLYMLPIEGTKPDGPIVINVTAARDLAKRDTPKVLDSTIERKRIALNRFFMRESHGYEGFEVRTYNPWDFPPT